MIEYADWQQMTSSRDRKVLTRVLPVLPEDLVGSAAFDASGTRVLIGYDGGTARLWDAETGAELTVLQGHQGQVDSVAFNPSGTRVLTTSEDDTARLWDAVTGAELLVLRLECITDAAFDPSGMRVLTASGDGTARLWDALTGAGLAVLRGHGGCVRSGAVVA